MSKQYSLTLSMWGCYEMRRIRGKEHGVGAVRQQKKIIPAYSGPPSGGMITSGCGLIFLFERR